MSTAETRRSPSERHIWRTTKLIEGFLPEISSVLGREFIDPWCDLKDWRNNTIIYQNMLLAARNISKSGCRVESRETLVFQETPITHSIIRFPLLLNIDGILEKFINSITEEETKKIPPSQEKIREILVKAGWIDGQYDESYFKIWEKEITPLLPRGRSVIVGKFLPVLKQHIKQVSC